MPKIKYFVRVKLESNLFFGVTKREVDKKGRKKRGEILTSNCLSESHSLFPDNNQNLFIYKEEWENKYNIVTNVAKLIFIHFRVF